MSIIKKNEFSFGQFPIYLSNDFITLIIKKTNLKVIFNNNQSQYKDNH